jgi:hypothetical protein
MVRVMHSLVAGHNHHYLPQLADFDYSQLQLRTKTDTYVLFTSLPHLFFEPWHPFVPLLDCQLGEYTHLARAVVNISIHPDDAYLGKDGELRNLFRFPHARECVWIFHRAPFPCWTQPYLMERPPVRTLRAGVRRMLRRLVSAIVSTLLETGSATSIVGLEGLVWPDYVFEGRDAPHLKLDSVEWFRTRLEASPLWTRRPAPLDPATAVKAITFKTLAQYRAEVGEDRAGLETSEMGSLSETFVPDIDPDDTGYMEIFQPYDWEPESEEGNWEGP